MELGLAEYIWVDGTKPTQRLRSKSKVVETYVSGTTIDSFPKWNFDGSSTNQAGTDDADRFLTPVSFVADPIRGRGNYLVLCEVFDGEGKPHESNQRAKLRATLAGGAESLESWFGFEQEYTLFKGRDPLGWPKGGYPAPQGPFYCGVGADEVFGRDLVEKHAQLCLKAGLMFYGINAEVMPGQWEFQVGPRGLSSETPDPLTVSDHLWLARWLLYRVGEDFGISATLHPKPVKGDWNGAGMHTNVSTKETRDKSTGSAAIERAVVALSQNHNKHIAFYGDGIAERLTGEHETCSIEEFKSGVANRGASIRVPRQVQEDGCGYFEDRRPCANADPYVVCKTILDTIS